MKGLRRLGSIVVMFSLALGLVATSGPDSQAKTKSYTIFAGEAGQISIYGAKIKSVKSSKKSVIKAKKKSSNQVNVVSKKAGKATVTVKTNRGNSYYKFKVVKPKVTCKLKSIANTSGSIYAVAFEIVNKTSLPIYKAQINYSLFDAAGTPIKEDYQTVYHLPKGKKAHIVVTAYSASPITSASASLGGAASYMGYKTKDVSKKVTAKLNGTKSITLKSKVSGSVSGVAEVLGYDANGNIIDVYSATISFYKKGKETRSIYLGSGPVRWTISKRAVYQKYVG